MAENLPNSEGDAAEGWSPCAAGELTRAAQTAAAARRRSKWTEAGPTIVACLLMVAGGFYYFATEDPAEPAGVPPGAGLAGTEIPPYGGIPCGVCAAQFEAFHDHQLQTKRMTDEELLERVARHLADCKICRAKYNEMYPDTPLKEVARELIRTGADPVLLAYAYAGAPAR